jgi:butyrate kinase
VSIKQVGPPKVYRVLVINPGSNSTKIAVFENEKKIRQFSVLHEPEIIGSFTSVVYEQYEYRLTCILNALKEKQIDLKSFDAVAGRGGFFAESAKSGTYQVNDVMVEHLKHPTSQHVANLGGILAKELADEAGVNAYITDPVCVDEMTEIAKVSGFEGIERLPKWQPLSHKATAGKLAEMIGKKYTDCNLIIGHLGGGISIGSHQKGRVVDINNGLDGDGPFSVDRPGQVPIHALISYCFDSGKTKEEVVKTFISKGGLYSYFGTVNTIEIEKKALSGDPKAKLILNAMAYGIAKEIGSNAAVLKGQVNAIGLTGGLANSKYITSRITECVSFIAPVYIFPGEFEMESLALGALRSLTGEEKAMVLKEKER